MKNPLKSENTFINRNNLPLILTGVLTLFLLFLFGAEQFDEESTSNPNFANELYSATLKPLFTSDTIDKEDVLTFAVKGDLPLDDNRKVLQVGVDSEGNETLEIINNRELVTSDDYAKIIEKLSLTVERKAEFDSILNSYQDELTDLIYLGDDSLIAVDPKIGLLRNSINYDLSTFIRKIKYNLPDVSYLGERNGERLYDIINNQSDKKPSNYIVFTPDSVVRREFHFVEQKEKELEFQPRVMVLNSHERLSPEVDDGFSFDFDSNFVKVTLENNYSNDIDLYELGLFNMVIDSGNNDLKLSLEVLKDSLENITLKLSYADSLNNRIKYEMNSDDIGNAITNSIKIFSGKDIDEWIEYGLQMDSLSRAIDSAVNAEIKKIERSEK